MGAAIAGYRIEAVLGHGSTGTVYSALDTGLDRRVALKVLTPSCTATSASASASCANRRSLPRSSTRTSSRSTPPERPTARSTWATGADDPWPVRMRTAHDVGGAARAEAYRRLVAGMLLCRPARSALRTQNGPAQVFSSRIGCQVFRPQDWGYVDLAALCLRGKSERAALCHT